MDLKIFNKTASSNEFKFKKLELEKNAEIL